MDLAWPQLVPYEDLMAVPYATFNCEGLMREVLRRAGVLLPVLGSIPEEEYRALWEEVPRADLAPLDTIWWELTPGGVEMFSRKAGRPVTHHVAICIRPGAVLNAAPVTGGAVVFDVRRLFQLRIAGLDHASARCARLRPEAREKYRCQP
jgi:cell wall-associated NlpC family hydrolase